jgi:quinol monooxygenase YgiN
VCSSDLQEAELEAILLELIEPSRAEAGCLRYDLVRSGDGGGEFVFIEEWASDEALELHRQTDHLREAKVRVQGSIASEPRVHLYKRIA